MSAREVASETLKLLLLVGMFAVAFVLLYGVGF